MKRLLKLPTVLGCAAFLLPLLFLAVVAEENARGYFRLERIKRRLHSQGEALTLPELHLLAPPTGGNAAPALERAATELSVLLKKYPAVSDATSGLMSFAGPAQATARSRAGNFSPDRPKPGREPVLRTWAELESVLAQGDAPLARLHAALRQPVVVPEIDYGDSKAALSEAWRAWMWLAATALDALHRQDLDAASTNITAMLNLAAYMTKDLRLTHQVMATGAESLSLAVIWEALQAEGWTDAQLNAWHSALIQLHPMDAIVGSHALGQVQALRYFDESKRDGDGRMRLLSAEEGITIDLLGGKEIVSAEWVTGAKSILWQILWTRQDEARTLELWHPFVMSSRQLHDEQSWAAFSRRTPAKSAGLVGLDRWMYCLSEILDPEVYRQMLKRSVQVETQRQMTLAAIALRRYASGHPGTLPPSLDALVPDLLPQVPVDWMDGKPLRYRPGADGKSFLLYSVGLDGKDDGGDPAPAAHDPSKHYNLWEGRDAVWPTLVNAPAAASQ